jgi:hypothetical protein
MLAQRMRKERAPRFVQLNPFVPLFAAARRDMSMSAQLVVARKADLVFRRIMGQRYFRVGRRQAAALRPEFHGNARVPLRFCLAKNENPGLTRILGVGNPPGITLAG